MWSRFARRVSGRPLRHLLAATAVLLALAAPALDMETGFPDAGNDSAHTTHRRAYDLVAEGFGPGANAPLLLVADLTRPGVGAEGITALAERVAADPGIASVGEPRTSRSGDTVVLPTLPTTAPADAATSRTLARVRGLVPGNVSVSGLTAMTDDLTTQLVSTLPVFVAATLGASFLLLLVVFRSVALPLKAVAVNLFSIAGAYGVVVAVFQWGWFGGLFGLEETLPIASPLPTVFFAVLFGLSMDYEVFLLSRVREEYDATGDTTEAVARGMAATGRVITSAALIMTVVFLGFVGNPSPLVKMMGLGLATAIVLDATIVRLVLVPASMALLGRAAWWLPRSLDRRLPRWGLGHDTAAGPTADPAPVRGAGAAWSRAPARRTRRRHEGHDEAGSASSRGARPSGAAHPAVPASVHLRRLSADGRPLRAAQGPPPPRLPHPNAVTSRTPTITLDPIICFFDLLRSSLEQADHTSDDSA
ncbi:MMPL family transporter [Streptomyces sp. CC228A]|uniref:MMPL family transporter n=1 Tax=Streptomyces sp. CC228A TaxID=2898186 RepID=UPI001F2F2734|nr:MMPL family transporter [Streptomyces sp. CC228A]